jgi:hypothetical protein
MKTYQKEISWVSPELNETQDGTIEVVKTKTATFKELSRLDKTQHKLHFKIISMFEGMQDDQKESLRNASTAEEKQEVLNDSDISINSDGLYDITVKAINQLLLTDKEFTEMDKKELLQDSIALLNLGLWLFSTQFAPFFQKLTPS